MQDSDLILIEKAKQGDRNAFRQLLETHYDLLYRIAYRLSGYAQDAGDIAQEVCVKLVDKIESFRGESRLTTWLYQITLNVWRDFAKKQSSRRHLEQSYASLETLQESPDPERARWLYQNIARLEPTLRETALLVLAEDLSHAEAAQVLDCAESTISWRMSEIRKLLKNLVEAHHVG